MPTRRSLLAALAASPAAATMPAMAQQGSFSAFLAGLRADARRQGVSDQVFNTAFQGVQPNAKIVALTKNQPEFTLTWAQYRQRVLPEKRLMAARDNSARLAELMQAVENRYGVDRYTIVGIWGIESGFGKNKGNYRLTEALATLAYAGHRQSYFRGELLKALQILQQGDVSALAMTSGWAGAMGQPQFMPSSYLQYAVDFDGDGRRDIWNSVPDVFGSVGNYLAGKGWTPGVPWGQPIVVPPNFDPLQAGHDQKRTLGQWMDMGVRRLNGSTFSRTDPMGAVLLPDGPTGDAFMVYSNFDVIKRYNSSDFYALAVGLLSDEAAGA